MEPNSRRRSLCEAIMRPQCDAEHRRVKDVGASCGASLLAISLGGAMRGAHGFAFLIKAPTVDADQFAKRPPQAPMNFQSAHRGRRSIFEALDECVGKCSECSPQALITS